MLSLPFAKIVYDVCRGLPQNSVLISGVDPYTLPAKHQTLEIGAGVTNWGPQLSVIFSTKGLDGKTYASSLGDYLAIWVKRNFGSEMPIIIVSFVTAVAVTLLSIRLIQVIQFERRRREDRKLAVGFRQVNLSFRKVDVYVSRGFSGTPFTGGLLRPYICLPSDAKEGLSEQELEAVIGHELGHIYQFDLPLTILIQAIGDLFWFVPGYRWLSRKIANLREIIADEWAVKRGADATLLASSLLKLKEIPETSERFVLYSAFFRKKSLLMTRVQRLLEGDFDRPSRLGWRFLPVRLIASFWIFMAVMMTTFGGNHATTNIENPDWFNHLLNAVGLS